MLIRAKWRLTFWVSFGWACLLVVIVLPLQGHRDSEKAGAYAERREYSAPLSGEERTALATERLAALTGYLVGGTAAVAVFTLLLWSSTQRLAKEAKGSAEGTLRQLQETSRQEHRAWIISDLCVSTANLADDKRQILSHRVHPRWKNTGRSPALRGQGWTIKRLVPRGETLEILIDDPEPPRNWHGVVGPTITVEGPGIVVTVADLAQIYDGHATLLIWAGFYYDDIYGITRHHTRCCFMLTNNEPPQRKIVSGQALQGFRFSFVGTQNTAT